MNKMPRKVWKKK